jgi:hypothetical protein
MDATILALVMTLIRQLVKNPKRKQALRDRMLKLRDAINAAYDAD